MNTVPPAGAACHNLRAHLDAYLSRELPEETSREVQRHLDSCTQCAAEFETLARIRAELQAAVRATPVPAGLDARVQRDLRSDARRPRTGLWAVAAAAAVIACVVLVNLWHTYSNPEQAILRKTSGRLAAVLNVGLRDHLHCAVFRQYSKHPVAAAQMAADLGPGFADLIPLVQAKLPGDFHILQAHRCETGGRQYMHFIIFGGDTGAAGGKIVSLVLTRKLSGESLAGGIHQTGVDRFQVVGFESHDYLAYVVSDLDAQQTLQLTANLAPLLRQYLAEHAG
jgi:anti-sigma factor (TIGR02949 family)